MKRGLIIAWLALALLIAACDRTETPTGAPTGEGLATVGPTLAATTTAPATPTAATPMAVATTAATVTMPMPGATSTAAPTATFTPAPSVTAQPTTIVADIPVLQGMALYLHISGGIAGFCDDLALFANGQVLYGPCGNIATTTLDETRCGQLLAWEKTYAPFQFAFEDNPGGPDSMKTTVVFAGKGTATAADDEMREIMDWARQVYAELAKRSAPVPTPEVWPTVTPSPPGAAVSSELRVFQNAALSFPYPAAAEIVPQGTGRWQLIGPQVQIMSPESGARWAVPGYVMEIALYDNPERLSSAEWARAHLLQSWQTAQEKQEPFTGPVADGEIIAERVADVRVGDKAAFRADWMGGDHIQQVVYLALGDRVAAFSFALYPTENYPLAEAAADIYALMLAHITAPAATGAASDVPAALDIARFVGPGFAILQPANATAGEVTENHWELVGPEIHIAPADGDWTWQGPAYRLDLILHDNPDKLSAAEWAAAYLVAEWEKAKQEGVPFTGPVDEAGEIKPEATALIQRDGEPAYRADWVAGDGVHRVVFMRAADKVLAVHYDIVAVENNPAAALMDAAHALLLHSLQTAP